MGVTNLDNQIRKYEARRDEREARKAAERANYERARKQYERSQMIWPRRVLAELADVAKEWIR